MRARQPQRALQLREARASPTIAIAGSSTTRHSPLGLVRDRHGLDLDVAAPVGLVVAALDHAEQRGGAHAPRALVAAARAEAHADRAIRGGEQVVEGLGLLGGRRRRRGRRQRARPRGARRIHAARRRPGSTRWPPSTTGRGCSAGGDVAAAALELGAVLPQRASAAPATAARGDRAASRERGELVARQRVEQRRTDRRPSARATTRRRLLDVEHAGRRRPVSRALEADSRAARASRRTARRAAAWARHVRDAFTLTEQHDTSAACALARARRRAGDRGLRARRSTVRSSTSARAIATTPTSSRPSSATLPGARPRRR